MLGNHLYLDERPSSEAEMIKNQAVVQSKQEVPLLRPCHFNSQVGHLTHKKQKNLCVTLDIDLLTENLILTTDFSYRTVAQAALVTPGKHPSMCNQTSVAQLILKLLKYHVTSMPRPMHDFFSLLKSSSKLKLQSVLIMSYVQFFHFHNFDLHDTLVSKKFW